MAMSAEALAEAVGQRGVYVSAAVAGRVLAVDTTRIKALAAEGHIGKRLIPGARTGFALGDVLKLAVEGQK